jgi:hypothetical protein
MNQYPNQEPSQQPYQGYAPRPGNPYEYQQAYRPSTSQRQPSPTEHPAIRPLGRRGDLVALGGILAVIGFFLPYYATYSGYLLARLYGMYWLDILFVTAALLLLIARLVLPVLQTYKRRWALALLLVGISGAFLHYTIVSLDSVPRYWGIGAWLYFLGMLAITLGGILLCI